MSVKPLAGTAVARKARLVGSIASMAVVVAGTTVLAATPASAALPNCNTYSRLGEGAAKALVPTYNGNKDCVMGSGERLARRMGPAAHHGQLLRPEHRRRQQFRARHPLRAHQGAAADRGLGRRCLRASHQITHDLVPRSRRAKLRVRRLTNGRRAPALPDFRRAASRGRRRDPRGGPGRGRAALPAATVRRGRRAVVDALRDSGPGRRDSLRSSRTWSSMSAGRVGGAKGAGDIENVCGFGHRAPAAPARARPHRRPGVPVAPPGRRRLSIKGAATRDETCCLGVCSG